jgi:hypothetical protein
LKIKGYLFYYPILNGEETIPQTNNVLDVENNPKIKVFWLERLIPDENLHHLKFFPKGDQFWLTDRSKADWKNRVTCFIFLDEKFDFIANNKLKIRKSPAEWIDHPYCSTEYSTKAFTE